MSVERRAVVWQERVRPNTKEVAACNSSRSPEEGTK